MLIVTTECEMVFFVFLFLNKTILHSFFTTLEFQTYVRQCLTGQLGQIRQSEFKNVFNKL